MNIQKSILFFNVLVLLFSQANASYLRSTQHNKNLFSDFKPLYTDRLIIREFKEKDCQDLYKLLSDIEVVDQTVALELHTHIGQTKKLIEVICSTYSEISALDWSIFAICSKDTEQLMGYCGFYGYIPLFNRAEIGYALSKDFWGKGFVPEACKALVEYGFKHLNLNRIEATVYPENIGSIRVLEKIGMKQEGILRKHVVRQGNYRNRLIYSLLKDEWLTHQIGK